MPTDPLGVLTTTQPVVTAARQVQIDPAGLATTADQLLASAIAPPAWNTHYHYAGPPLATALYIVVLDTLNFCFWGEPRWRISYEGEWLDGYWALAAALKRAVLAGEPVLEPTALATIDALTLGRWLAGEGELPLLAERVANLRELGRGLDERWGGTIARLIGAAAGSAPRLAGLLAREFPSFDDRTSYAGRPVNLYKRAQICAGDLYAAFGGQGLGALSELDQLTAFADYKVPQVLRRLGVLVYSDELADLIERRVELAPGSAAEVEIRAATIWGVERLRQALTARGRPLAAVQLDWYLWELGQRVRDERPYHRTRTIFY